MKKTLHPKFVLLHHVFLIAPFIALPIFMVHLKSQYILYHLMGLFFSFIAFAIILVTNWIRYSCVSFIINENSIQYKNDFITLSTKNLYLKNIKEITLHRSVLQKIFDLGTIEVASHATTPDAGIKLYNLDNYQEIYDFLITKIQNTY